MEWNVAFPFAHGCAHLGQMQCDFYTLMKNRLCANGPDVTSGKQQCIVSSRCTDLNGGSRINEDLNYKICDDTRSDAPDTLLQNYTLKQLQAFIKSNKMDTLMTLHLAFPTETFAEWEDVIPYFYNEGEEYVKDKIREKVFNKSAPGPNATYKGIYDFTKTNKVGLFRTKGPPEAKTVFYGIVEGNAAYDVTYIGENEQGRMIKDAMGFEDKGYVGWVDKKWKISCLANCR